MLSLIGGFIEFLIIKSCFFCKWIFDKIDQIESNQTATVSPLHRDFGAGIGRAVFKSGINRRCAVMMLPVPEYQSRLCGIMRSEEHTSELQSRGHLVCRLLLE